MYGPEVPAGGGPSGARSVRRRPALTVDGVVLWRPSDPREGPDLLLLVERGCDPFRGQHALPGGFVDFGEDIDAAVHREIAEETGLRGLRFRQYRTFGRPDRDPRGHTVSVVYVARISGRLPGLQAGDDAAAAGWHPVTDLPELAFDHGEIVSRILADDAAGIPTADEA